MSVWWLVLSSRHDRYKCIPPGEHHRDFCHILREIAPISPGVWTAAKHLSSMRISSQGSKSIGLRHGLVLSPRAAQRHARKGACDALVGARGPRRDAAETFGVTEGRQGAHRHIPRATNPSGLSSNRRAVPDMRPRSVSKSATLDSQPIDKPLKAPLDTRFHLYAAPLDLGFASKLESCY
jgi:hypothetical protein